MSDPYNLRRRGRYWHADFTLYGTRVCKTTKRTLKSDATDRCAEWAQEIRDKAEGRVPKTAPPTLDEVYQAWARVKRDQFSDSHLNDMRVAVEVHAAPWQDRPLDQLDNAAIEEIRATYLSTDGAGYKINGGTTVRKHSKGGANQVVKQLRALCGWALATKKLDACPFHIRKLKPQELARQVLWPEKVKAFVEEADRGGRESQSKREDRKPPQSATALRMMVGLGLREGEALQADWGWVDWRREVFAVGGLALGRDVTVKDRSIREIPIPFWLLDHLRKVWADANEPSSGLILPAPGGGQHGQQFTTKPVERCGRVLGVEGLTPHRLRATFASGHFEAGTKLSQIQQMMGHDSPETTMKYIVQRPKDQAEAQARLAAIMGFEPAGSHAKITQCDIANIDKQTT